MKFSILYCKPCGYRDRAEVLATELRERFDASVSIEEGRLGQFDVLIDGEIVASKARTFFGRMLTHGAPPQSEILEAIERHLSLQTGDACAVSRRDGR